MTTASKKLRQNVCGGHRPAYAGQVGGVAEDASSTAAKISYSRKHGGGERGGGSGSGKPSQPSNERGKGDLANYKGELFPNNPDKLGKDHFTKISGTSVWRNKQDEMIWKECKAEHGGRQWECWKNEKSWRNNDKPMKVWPDGCVRKYGDQ